MVTAFLGKLAIGWTQAFFLAYINETNICLILKCDKLSLMKGMWSISLCNVIYKVISKLLANRLKLLLPKCVLKE